MYSIDHAHLQQKLQVSGLGTVLALAGATGLHRNTINHYLAGANVFQAGYLRICESLTVDPHDFICTRPHLDVPDWLAMALDETSRQHPDLVFVLFGSRARGAAKRFSDWDIGCYTQSKFTHQTYLKLLVKLDLLLGDQSDQVDLVDLTKADRDFLGTNQSSFRYLTGSLIQWNRFKSRLNDE